MTVCLSMTVNCFSGRGAIIGKSDIKQPGQQKAKQINISLEM